MRIYAFEGYRYAAGPSEAGELAAPPFDQIDDQLRDQLQATHPFHFTHLTRPLPGPEGDPYQHAAALHQQWCREARVQRDVQPCLYPYTIHMPDGGRRLGLCTLVGVEPEGSNVIRPHEKTLAKPFADRLNLLRSMQVDVEPVMFLADDAGELEALLEEDVKSAPVVEHHDAAGNVHRLFRVADAERIAAYRQALARYPAAIADGHHRYKVGRTYAEEVGAAEGTAAGCKMAVLFSLRDQHLVIDPIHRALAEGHDLKPLYDLIRSRQPLAVTDGNAVAAAVAAAEQPALAVQEHGKAPELWLLDPKQMPKGTPPGAAQLAVAHLHYVLLPALGLPPEAALDGTVTYRADPQNLYRQLAAGDFQLGVWLPPMTADAFGKAISKGDLLPAKSTRFLPKLASGMVWAGHDARLG